MTDRTVAVPATATHRPPAPYLCVTCGTARTARLNLFNARLKCAECTMVTRHIAAAPAGPQLDWCEVLNARANAATNEVRREIAKLTAGLTAMGVDIRDDRTSSEISRPIEWRPALFSLAVDREGGSEYWLMEIASDATVLGRRNALRRAVQQFVLDDRFKGDAEYVGFAFAPTDRNDILPR